MYRCITKGASNIPPSETDAHQLTHRSAPLSFDQHAHREGPGYSAPGGPRLLRTGRAPATPVENASTAASTVPNSNPIQVERLQQDRGLDGVYRKFIAIRRGGYRICKTHFGLTPTNHSCPLLNLQFPISDGPGNRNLRPMWGGAAAAVSHTELHCPLHNGKLHLQGQRPLSLFPCGP